MIQSQTKIDPTLSRMVKQVEAVTLKLTEIAKSEGMDPSILARIWAALPLEENDGMTYLEVASQCILEVSAAVDQVYSNLPYNQKIAKKYHLMAKLLTLKADQLV